MTPYELVVAGCWAVFLLVWLVSSISAKKSVATYSHGAWIRLVGIACIITFFSLSGLKNYTAVTFTEPLLPLIGAALTVGGIAFAVWARIYLGKNWGMPMTTKENPELVTTGPYAYVRHPIYTGVILAMLGSALASAAAWLMVMLIFIAYFWYSAKQEEKQMLKEFPDTYPAYMRHTKMLIPFVL